MTELNAQLLEKAQAFVHANIDKVIRLDDIASAVGLDKYALTRLFNRHGISTPAKWLWKERVNLAAVKLDKEPNSQIVKVSVECGFTSPQHFSRYFKQYIGVTPREYRKGVRLGTAEVTE